MSIISKIKRKIKIHEYRQQINAMIDGVLLYRENPQNTSWGSISEEEEAGIRHAVMQASHYEGPIVEIGALFGHTTSLIASLKGKEVPLFAVENFTWNPFGLPPNEHRLFLRRSIRYALDHCATRIFDGDAADFYLANAALRPRMVFIDAGHDYPSVMQDIEWAVSAGCPIISGHDYGKGFPGVMRAVDEKFNHEITLYGSVWIHQKP